MRYSWDGAEVDAKLVGIMKNIHAMSVEAAEAAGLGYNLVAGANIAGFKKVAAAMMAQGSGIIRIEYIKHNGLKTNSPKGLSLRGFLCKKFFIFFAFFRLFQGVNRLYNRKEKQAQAMEV